MNLNIVTRDPEETQKLGKRISKLVLPGDLFAFYGELGAGKTCFIQGVCQGLGVRDYVTSPSFTIINEYKGRVPVYHFDLFRLNSLEEFLDLGYEEYFYGEGLTVIEWAEKVESLLPFGHLKISIEFFNYSQRIIYFATSSDRYKVFLKELIQSENIRD